MSVFSPWQCFFRSSISSPLSVLGIPAASPLSAHTLRAQINSIFFCCSKLPSCCLSVVFSRRFFQNSQSTRPSLPLLAIVFRIHFLLISHTSTPSKTSFTTPFSRQATPPCGISRIFRTPDSLSLSLPEYGHCWMRYTIEFVCSP